MPNEKPDPYFNNDYVRLGFEFEAATLGQAPAEDILALQALGRLWCPDSADKPTEEDMQQAALNNFRWIREAIRTAVGQPHTEYKPDTEAGC